MELMKRFICHLLILLMLMPGLACGQWMCMKKAQAAEPQTHQAASQEMPCHKTKADSQSDGNANLMFMKDCAKSDLFKSDTQTSVKKPDMGKTFFFALADAPALRPALAASDYTIRGPPLDWPDVTQTDTPIILKTLRFLE